MLRTASHNPGAWLVSGGYVVLLVAGSHIDTPLAWRASVGGIIALAFIAWLLALRRLRAINDMPTSRIASAAQGYVELIGRGLPDTPLSSPLTGVPCLWFTYRIEEKSGDKWVTRKTDTSIESFWIDDDTGRCLIHPSGAEVLASHHKTWEEGDFRYTQSLLLENETIYALGEFRTYGGGNLELDVRQDVGELLAEWKTDQPALLRRFDANGDGSIDLQEWEEARAAARREVEQAHRSLRQTTPDTATLGQPADGRLFLLSSLPESSISLRYRLWCYAHVAIFLAAVGGEHYLWFGW